MKRKMVISLVIAIAMASSVWAKMGGGDILFRVAGAGNVVFTHDSHVGAQGLKCNECHYRLYTTVEGHSKRTMADMEQGKSCGACHDGRKAFDVRMSCSRCHKK